jgi:hypothetical protein
VFKSTLPLQQPDSKFWSSKSFNPTQHSCSSTKPHDVPIQLEWLVGNPYYQSPKLSLVIHDTRWSSLGEQGIINELNELYY